MQLAVLDLYVKDTLCFALLSFLRTAATIDSYVIAAISMYLLSVFYNYSTIVLHIQ